MQAIQEIVPVKVFHEARSFSFLKRFDEGFPLRFLKFEEPQCRADHFAHGGKPAGSHLLGNEFLKVVA
jgi:hypothetical protein